MDKRRSLITAVNLSLLLTFVIAALAAASWTTIRVGNLIFKVDGRLSPEMLPRDSFGPSSFRARGQIRTADGAHPPALREGVIYIDRNSGFDAVGLPACGASQLEARDTRAAKRACGASIVGSGEGTGEIAFPEQAPIEVTSPITLFNGGVSGGTTTLLAHAFITIPAPTAIVTTLKWHRVESGRYGLEGTVAVPAIAGGSGSITGFDFRVKRLYTHNGKRKSYDLTKCPDGHIDIKGSGVFVDEVRDGIDDGKRTAVSASLVVPCTPKR
jgi:hypothetical protein